MLLPKTPAADQRILIKSRPSIQIPSRIFAAYPANLVFGWASAQDRAAGSLAALAVVAPHAPFPALSVHLRPYLVIFSSKFVLCLLYCKKLRGIRSNNLMLCVRCLYFYRYVFESRKKYSLPNVGLEKQKLFFFGKVKNLLHGVDRRRRLFKQKLNRRVRNNRLSVRRAHEVRYVLRDCCDPQVIFPRALGNAEKK